MLGHLDSGWGEVSHVLYRSVCMLPSHHVLTLLRLIILILCHILCSAPGLLKPIWCLFQCPGVAITNKHKLGGFKRQKFVLEAGSIKSRRACSL